MKEHNESGQELSAAQSDETSDGCPNCGGPIQAVTRRGPSDVVVKSCGHEVGDTLARNFPRTDKRAVTDGGSDVSCEVDDADEHCGPVQIVVDEDGDPIAMCWECRKKFDYERVVDEDPGPVRTDGGYRDVGEMDLEEIREEYHNVVRGIDFRRPDTDSDEWERHLELWAALEERADVEIPDCGNCGASNWRFARGEPASCAACEHHPETTEKAEAVWKASQKLQFGSTEADA